MIASLRIRRVSITLTATSGAAADSVSLAPYVAP